MLHGTKLLSVTRTLSEHIGVPYPCSILRLNNSLLNDRSRFQSIPENTWISNIIEVKDVIKNQITKISNEKINEGLLHPEGRSTKLPNASKIILLGFF